MATRIEKDDILNPQVIPGIIKDFESMVARLMIIMDNLKTQAKGVMDITSNLKPNSKCISELKKQHEEISKITTEQKKLLEVEKKAQDSISKYGRLLETAKQASKEKVDAVKREIAINREQSGSYKQMSLLLQQNIANYKKLSQVQRENSQIGGKLLTTIKQQQASLKKMDAEMGNFQRNVGNYGGAITKLKGLMLGWLAAIGGVMGALKLGKKVIDSTESSSDKFAVTIGKARSAFEYFTKALATGDFSNFFTNMKLAINAGAEYARQLDEIEDRNRALTIEESKLNIERQANLKILRDATKTDVQRIAAAETIIRKEDELMKVRVSVAQQAKDARIQSFIALGITEDIVKENLTNYEANKQIIKQADEYNKLLKDQKDAIKLRNEMFQQGVGEAAINAQDFIIETNKKVLESTDQSIIKFAALRTKYTKISEKELDELVKLYVDLYNAQASADENNQRINARLSSLLNDNLKKQEKEAKLQGTLNKLKERQAEIEKQIPSLNLETKAGRNRSVELDNELRRIKGLIKLWEDFLTLKPLASKNLKLDKDFNKITTYQIPVQKIDVPAEVTLKPVKIHTTWEKFWDGFDLSNKETLDTIDNFNQEFNYMLGEINQNILDSAEREVEIYDNKIEELKNNLDEEKKLKDEGRANDYDRLVAQIAEQQKLRDRANENLEKAQKRQAIIQLNAQISDIATASANIIVSWSETGGWAGAIAGLAQVAALIAAWSSYKNQINSIGSQKYAEGTEYVKGQGTDTSDSVDAKLSRGERIVPAGINRQLEGISNGLLPDIYNMYKLNVRELKNSGEYRYSNSEIVKELRSAKDINKQMLDYWKDKPVVQQLDNGKIMLIFGKHDIRVIDPK
jgi:hypothetical protein